ncbi:AAA family ATPase [Bacteroides sp. 519]|uniref:AAA family ATPase n=1 Tax=Bacteroides sp. 519 TaxID=2302937 RepID=UPI0013D4C36F|nr:AAA family ATPase [Bacteroides sp. 519]NDV57909.1 ATPase [Bacteroides sp. 519]
MEYIDIKGYKSIKDLHFEIKPINILIGANGAGKSNFISFFNFLKTAFDGELKSYVVGRGIDTILHNGRKKTQNLFSEISFEKGKNRYEFNLKVENKTFVVQSEKLWSHNNDNACEIADASTELKARLHTRQRALNIKAYMSDLKVYHFHDTGVNSPFNNDCNLIDNEVLQSKGGNLAAILYRLKNEEIIIYNRIVKVIQSVAPNFKDFDLAAKGSYINLTWRDKYSESLYGATDLSDGTIRFIALVTLFLQPNPPAVIIIDEPELGLHPFAINKLAGLVKSVTERGTQVILSTQSVELVNNFAPNDIVTVDNINGVSTFNRLNEQQLSQWLEDYAVGDLWRQNLLNSGFPNK